MKQKKHGRGGVIEEGVVCQGHQDYYNSPEINIPLPLYTHTVYEPHTFKGPHSLLRVYIQSQSEAMCIHAYYTAIQTTRGPCAID